MKKRFILLEKYYFISGEKTGRTCAKMQTAIFLDSATVNVFFSSSLYYLVDVCFVSREEYI